MGETIAKTFSFGQKVRQILMRHIAMLTKFHIRAQSEAEKSETRKTLEDVGRAFEDVDEQLKLG